MLKIHSVAEAYLLLMVTRCERCGKGPFKALRHEELDLGGQTGRRLFAACQACGHERQFDFDLSSVPPEDLSAEPAEKLPRINRTSEPSRVIDLAQWLMLFEAIALAAGGEDDPAESRRLAYEAAQCLEEALKFYREGCEWPDESAFFHEWTLRRFRENRHLFARTRLVEMRRRLPSIRQMEEHLTGRARRVRPWWAFWRRK